MLIYLLQLNNHNTQADIQTHTYRHTDTYVLKIFQFSTAFNAKEFSSFYYFHPSTTLQLQSAQLKVSPSWLMENYRPTWTNHFLFFLISKLNTQLNTQYIAQIIVGDTETTTLCWQYHSKLQKKN